MKPHLKFCIHPGWVESKSDGDRHFIGYLQLIRLYGVDPAACIVADPARPARFADLINLFPRYHGDYEEHLQEIMK